MQFVHLRSDESRQTELDNLRKLVKANELNYGRCKKCGTIMTAPPRRWGMSCTKYCPKCKAGEM